MRRKRLPLKRPIAFLLMLATLLSIVSVPAFATEALAPEANESIADIIILHNNAEISSLTLTEDGKETLSALVMLDYYDSRAWQIRIPNTEEWVNISGKNGETLDVTFAQIGRAHV